jgi:uncharacterized RDD family membrane protein YckC
MVMKTTRLAFVSLVTAAVVAVLAARATAQSLTEPVGPPARSTVTVLAQATPPAEPPVAPQAPEPPDPPNQAGAAAAGQQGAEDQSAAADDAAASPGETGPQVEIRRIGQPAVRIMQDYVLPAGDVVREVVVISGSARIGGEVQGDVVVVLGEVTFESTAVVGGDTVVVGGQMTVQPGAVLERDLVVVASGFDAPLDFSAGRDQVVIGPGAIGERIRGVLPWVTTGLLWGRLIVPSLPMVWAFVALFFFLYAVLNLVFDRPVAVITGIIAERPLSAFLVGLLVLLLTGPVSVILSVSVIGIPVIPFLFFALLIGGLLGKVATMRWIGSNVMVQDDAEDRRQSLRSFAIGFVIVTVLYMVPILGIVSWATLGLFALGGAVMAFFAALRRENPAPEPPPVPPASPTSPDGSMTPAPDDASAFVSESGVGDGGATAGTPPPAPPPAPPPPAPPAGSLLAMPRARFLDRAAAFFLDLLLVGLVYQLVELRVGRANTFFLLLLGYHIVFWAFRATTLGGIICNLRVVRVDGTALRFADALIRGLSAIFSLAVLGLGAFWIIWDPEQQSWHDRIAGTYVVKVPRTYQG